MHLEFRSEWEQNGRSTIYMYINTIKLINKTFIMKILDTNCWEIHSIILKIVKVVYKEQGKNKILVKRKLGLFLSFFPFSFPKGLLLNVYVHVEIFSFSSKICPNDFLSIKRYCMKNILFHNLEEVFIYLKSRK